MKNLRPITTIRISRVATTLDDLPKFSDLPEGELKEAAAHLAGRASRLMDAEVLAICRGEPSRAQMKPAKVVRVR